MEEMELSEEMEMPTPCLHCGGWFDLNDGHGSEKWYPNKVICPKCGREEEAEIEEDERWEEINIEISNALYHLKEEGAWAKLTDENRALIIQYGSNSLLLNEYNDIDTVGKCANCGVEFHIHKKQ